MPNPSAIYEFVDDLARDMIADILELWTPAEIKELVEEMERKQRQNKLH
jgi:hypothetical protein